MNSVRILIVGGGIGGLSAAIALCDKGFAVNVVELKPDLHSSVYGVGIIQPVNALRALEMIGCAEACMQAGYSTAAWGRLLDAEGNLIGEIPGSQIPGSDLPPMNGITRPKLHEILTARALEAGAAIEYDRTFTDLVDGPDGVRVVMNDGAELAVDLVVGADGAYSKVRKYVLGPGVEPTYVGQSCFRYNVPRTIPGYGEIDRIILQHGDEGMAGFVPIGPELAYIFYNSTWAENTRLDEDRLDAVMRERLAGFGGLTGLVRDRYINDPAQVVFRPEDSLIAPRPWHKGRIVLIGDAVHAVTPHLGQGVAQAIEDAVVLADCLAAAADHEIAFGRYADRRYERCKLIVESSALIAEWEMHPGPGQDHRGVRQRVFETMIEPI